MSTWTSSKPKEAVKGNTPIEPKEENKPKTEHWWSTDKTHAPVAEEPIPETAHEDPKHDKKLKKKK